MCCEGPGRDLLACRQSARGAREADVRRISAHDLRNVDGLRCGEDLADYGIVQRKSQRCPVVSECCLDSVVAVQFNSARTHVNRRCERRLTVGIEAGRVVTFVFVVIEVEFDRDAFVIP